MKLFPQSQHLFQLQDNAQKFVSIINNVNLQSISKDYRELLREEAILYIHSCARVIFDFVFETTNQDVFMRVDNLVNQINHIFNFDDYIKRISILERSSKEEFVKHYFSIYEEENHVPIWILIEIIPFGNISKMYEYMLNDDKKEVSKKFDVSKPDFESWLENITLLRNFCAHNSIIWNKKINSVARKSKKWKQNIKWDKISGMIFLLNYLVKQINPQFSSERLYTLLSDFHENHNAKFKELGFQEKNDIRFLKDIS